MKYKLVIFDMDGTLVQSEACASQALKDVIPALTDTVQEVTVRYRGMRLVDIFDDVENRIPGAIPDNCLSLYREREEVLSTTMITASVDADAMLSQLLEQKCIASNAPIEKTKRSLHISGLSRHFQSGIFSAYDVNAWKPDPRLFEHAARSYNVCPSDCLVVEDSEVGIQAAKAAGMVDVFYDPNNITDSTVSKRTITNLKQLLDFL